MRRVRAIGVALIWLSLCAVVPQHAAGQFTPIRASYDAIPGEPLIIAVRLDEGHRPKPRVPLRFPDGREIMGEVAAVRLIPPGRGGGWLAEGPTWRVLAPHEARAREGLTWFVLVDLPEDVIGQEIWLAGRPVSLRWLPRPRLMASRLGFDADRPGDSPLTDPWLSPVPESWRDRPDLTEAFGPALRDPLRRWRAVLAMHGLHPRRNRGVGPITPELLGSGLVEASARVAPLADRLLGAISAQNEARWRIALARLWAADPGLSLRVRQALAGAGWFPIGVHPGEAAVVPMWTADDRMASGLLSSLLEGDAASRAAEAQRWLNSTPSLALRVIDDGVAGGSATIGAVYFGAGDTTAIPLAGPGETPRPVLLATRKESVLRPAVRPADRAGVSVFEARIAGRIERVLYRPGPVPLEPPGETIGPVWADHSMATLLLADPKTRAARLARSGLAGRITKTATGGRWAVFLRVESPGTIRVWIGPAGHAAGVISVEVEGGLDLQRFERTGDRLGDPAVVRETDARGITRLEITLPDGSVEPDGTLHIGLEFERGSGVRWAWPRPMLPWQIEPGRRVLDTKAWMGGLETGG